MSLPLLLASKSPRRRQLLGRITSHFEIHTEEVEELIHHPEGPDCLAETNAILKATAVSSKFPNSLVIGSDTVVAYHGNSLGKPKDLAHAREMLRSLSGREHEVFSGVALESDGLDIHESWVVRSAVKFFDLGEEQIDYYLGAIDFKQFAGAYPIQHLLGSLTAGFEGSYSNIVGLPLERLQIRLNALRK